MDLVLTLIDNFFNGVISDINNCIEKKKEKLTLSAMATLKTIYTIVFIVCFLLGNFTSMLGIIFKDALGYGIIFPISSSFVLYIITLVSLAKLLFYKKEMSFLEKKLKYDKEKQSCSK